MKDKSNFLENLKEELDMMNPSFPTITVSRKDLELLIKCYEHALKNADYRDLSKLK